MNCQDFKIQVEEQDVREDSGASEHLNACVSCRKHYDEHTALRRLMSELEVVTAPPNFDFRLRARLAAIENAKRWETVRRAFAPGFVSITLAACFALTFGVTLFVKQASHDEVARLSAVSSQEVLAYQTSRDERSISQNEKTADYSSVPNNLQESPRTVYSPRRIRSRAASNPIVINADGVEGRVVSSSLGVQGATLYTANAGNSVGVSNNIINVPVSAGALEVSARDDDGASRKMSLKSVSFGAQELVNSPGNSPRKLTAATGSAW